MLLFICFASAILGDSTAEALLLAHFDARLIPMMFLVNAFSLFIISTVMMSIVDRIDRGQFFQVATFVHASLLVLIRLAVMAKWEFFYLPLFTYAYISKIIFFMMFWTLVNDLIDSRKAGTEFPVIAAGGTFGAIAVSFSIPWLMKYIAAENLLLIWAVLVMGAGISFIPLRARCGKKFKARPDRQKKRGIFNLQTIFKDSILIKDEPLLRGMSLLYFALFFLLLNQHYTFYSQLKTHFTTANQVAGFLGMFNGLSMFATLVLQLTVSGRILKAAGSTRSMLLLPVVLTGVFAFLGILVMFGSVTTTFLFWSVAAGMGLRVAFFDSFFSPNFQIFFSSFPKEIRGRGKLLIEGVVKPFSMVVAGLWLLWIAPRVSFGLNMLLLFVLSVFAIFQTWRLKAKYAESLTKHLAGYSSSKETALLQRFELPGEQNLFSFLSDKLEAEDFEVKQFIIELLSNSDAPEAFAVLSEHLEKSEGRVRATIIAAIGNLHKAESKDQLIDKLSDVDERVVANAVLALAHYNDLQLVSYLEPLLKHSNNRVRANTILAIWPYIDDEKKGILFVKLKIMLIDNYPRETASALYVLGEIESPEAQELLYEFHSIAPQIAQGDPMTFRQMIGALAKKPQKRSVDILLQIAQKSNRLRKLEIVCQLSKLIRIFAEEDILALLKSGNSLSRNLLMRAIHGELTFVSDRMESLLRSIAGEEQKGLERNLDMVSGMLNCSVTGVELLCHTLTEEMINLKLDTLVFIASVLDSSARIRKIIPRLFHSDRHMRARAFEVMDNTGDLKINRFIMRVIEQKDLLVPLHNSTFSKEDIYSTLKTLSSHENEWVNSCARYSAYCFHESTGEKRWAALLEEN